MLKPERESEIVRRLLESESGTLRVGQLSEVLRVSEMTIRRDLDELEARGLVRRVHGGVMHAGESLLIERSFTDRGREAHTQKVDIGRAAAALVGEGDVVIIDAGTTTLQLARRLGVAKLTAVTNALPIATELASHQGVSAILLGGNLKGPELCTVGPIATEALAQMAADTVFLSCTGFSLDRGVTDPDLREAEVKRAMIRAAKRVVLLADSGKYGAVAFAQVTPLDGIGTIVTDAALPPEARSAIGARGVDLIIAER